MRPLPNLEKFALFFPGRYTGDPSFLVFATRQLKSKHGMSLQHVSVLNEALRQDQKEDCERLELRTLNLCIVHTSVFDDTFFFFASNDDSTSQLGYIFLFCNEKPTAMRSFMKVRNLRWS